LTDSLSGRPHNAQLSLAKVGSYEWQQADDFHRELMSELCSA